MKNKYIRRSKITEAKFRQILRCFCLDITATNASKLTGVSRQTLNRLFYLLRKKTALALTNSGKTLGTFEFDDSYFGVCRVRGKRGRGAAGKTPVFGLLHRDGKVYISVVKNCSKEQLMPIIQGHILEDATIHTDRWKAYDAIILNGYDYYRVFHSHDAFAKEKCHIDGIEGFWSFTKRRLAQFNGLTDQMFFLHLKECAFRFNNRQFDLYAIMLSMLREDPL